MKRSLFLASIALSNTGCFQSERQQTESDHHARTISAEGTVAGVPFALTAKEEGATDHERVDQRSLAFDPAILQAVAEAAKVAAPLIPGGGPVVAGALSLASAAGVAWLNARNRAKEHKADADEAWDKLVTSPAPKGATGG